MGSEGNKNSPKEFLNDIKDLKKEMENPILIQNLKPGKEIKGLTEAAKGYSRSNTKHVNFQGVDLDYPFGLFPKNEIEIQSLRLGVNRILITKILHNHNIFKNEPIKKINEIYDDEGNLIDLDE